MSALAVWVIFGPLIYYFFTYLLELSMAKSVADYFVLSDGSFVIDSIPDSNPTSDSVPVAKAFDFDIPNDFVEGTIKARPILQFMVKPESDDGTFGFWLNAQNNHFFLTAENQRQRFSWHGGGRREFATWECLQGDLFKRGETNQIRFGFAPGQNATVRIRDVVLWYQRYVED